MLYKYLQYIQSKQPQAYVIHNSSNDFDSLASSLLYSYFLHNIHHKIYSPLTPSHHNTIHLNKQTHTFITPLISDIPKLHNTNINNLPIYLIDWNDSQLPNANHVIDHHEKKKTFANQLIIPGVGSAISLLMGVWLQGNKQLKQVKESEKIRNFYKGLGGQYKYIQIDKEILQLVYITILLDTFNLSKPLLNVRYTQLDLFIHDYCLNHASPLPQYSYLQSLKYDAEYNLSLSASDILIKDYKQMKYQDCLIGFAVVNVNLERVLKKQGMREQIKMMYKRRSFNLFIVMSLFLRDGQYNRQMMIYSEQKDRLVQVCKFLQQNLQIEVMQRKVDQVLYVDVKKQITRKILDKVLMKWK